MTHEHAQRLDQGRVFLAGVVLSGVAIMTWGWSWLDRAVSLAVALVITLGTWGLLRESLSLAMDAVPEGIDPAAVEQYRVALPGVAAVHDLHIWGMSTTHSAVRHRTRDHPGRGRQRRALRSFRR